MSPPQPLNLAPLPQPIALLPSHIANSPTCLILTETTSGYDFTITDRATNQTLFTVKGRTDAHAACKDIFDAKGTHICSLVKDNTWKPKDYNLLKPDGSAFMDVVWKWGATAKMTSTFPNLSSSATHESITMTMSANYFTRNGDWKINNQVAAHVFRDFYTSGDLLKGTRTYYLDIAPGMDMSIAVASCLYLHERVNEWAASGGSGGINAYGSQPKVTKTELAGSGVETVGGM